MDALLLCALQCLLARKEEGLGAQQEGPIREAVNRSWEGTISTGGDCEKGNDSFRKYVHPQMSGCTLKAE